MKLPSKKTGSLVVFIFLTTISRLDAQPAQRLVCPELTISETQATNAGGTNLLATRLGVLEHSDYSLVSKIPDTTKRYSQYEKPYSRKSPAKAFFYGFFPGFIIHGIGHNYIGETKTGNLLLAGELISITIASISIPMGLGKAVDNEPGGEPTAETLTYFALMIFAGTWVYDFTAAPYKASKLNKQHEYSIKLQPRINGDMASLNMTVTFR